MSTLQKHFISDVVVTEPYTGQKVLPGTLVRHAAAPGLLGTVISRDEAFNHTHITVLWQREPPALPFAPPDRYEVGMDLAEVDELDQRIVREIAHGLLSAYQAASRDRDIRNIAIRRSVDGREHIDIERYSNDRLVHSRLHDRTVTGW